MSVSTSRRPLPALGFLLALTVLTSIVWWRVLHRHEADTATGPQTAASQRASCNSAGKQIVLPAVKNVSIRTVLNASQRDGLAAKVRDDLRARGFGVVDVATDTQPLDAVAQIRYGKAGKSAATLLSYYLTGATLAEANRADAAVDVVLGKKFTAVATPAAVTKAIAAAKKPC
jgi:hypothetical protein